MQSIRNTRREAANEKSFAWRNWAASLVVVGAATVAAGDVYAGTYYVNGGNAAANVDGTTLSTNLKDDKGVILAPQVALATNDAFVFASKDVLTLNGTPGVAMLGNVTTTVNSQGGLNVNLGAAANKLTFGNIGTTTEKLFDATFTQGIITANSVNATTVNVAADGALAAGSINANAVNITGALTANSLATTQVNLTGTFGALATNLTLDKTTNVLTQGGTFGADTGKTLTINGAVTGTTLNKIGDGALVLAGANTYAGATTIDAGTLTVTGSLASGNTVAMANNSVLHMNQGTAQTLGAITGAGSVVKSGTGTLTLSGANTYTGNTTINGGKLSVTGSLGSLVNVAAGVNAYAYAGNVAMASGSSLEFNQTAAANAQALTGKITGAGSVALQSVAGIYLLGNNDYTGGTTVGGGVVAGSDTAFGTGKVTLAQSTTLGLAEVVVGDSISIGNAIDLNSKTLTLWSNTTGTITGVISGAGTLTTDGMSKIALTGANIYTGTTTLAGGTLTIGNNTALGKSTVNVTNDTKLTTDGKAVYNVANAISITNAKTLTVENTSTKTFTLSGVVSGAGNLTKTGVGELVLAGANTYTGGTTITAGKLTVTGTLGTYNAVNRNYVHVGAISIAESSTLEFNQNVAQNLASVVMGKGDLIKSGTGTLTLGGANTYTGDTTISAGKLSVTGTLGDNIGGNTFVYASDISIANNSSLEFAQNANHNQALTGKITGAGSVVLANADANGNFYLNSDNNYTGGTTLNGATVGAGSNTAFGTGKITLTKDSSLGLYNVLTNKSTSLTNAIDLGGKMLTVGNNGTGTSTLSGAISGVGGKLVKDQDGTLALSGANSYSGGTTVNAGTLNLAHATGGVIDAAGTGGITMQNATVLQFGVGGRLNQAVTVNTDTAGAVVTLDAAKQNVTLASAIGQSKVANQASVVFDSTGGAGTFTLSNAAKYTGGTDIRANATVVAGEKNVLASSNNVFVSGKFDANGFDQKLTNLAQNGTIINSGRGNAAITLDNTQATEFTGKIVDGSGGGKTSVVKTGAENLTLSGANTYSGGTQLTAGTLTVGASSIVDAKGVITSGPLGTGTVSVTNNATLASKNDAAYNVANAISITDAKTLTVENTNANTFTLSGVIGGAGNLTKTGNGELVLSGANTYSGVTKVDGGTLTIKNTFTAQKDITVATGSMLNVAATTGALTIADGAKINIAGTGTVTNAGKIYTYAKTDAKDTALVAGSITGAGTIHVRAGADAGDLKVGGAKTQFFATGTGPDNYFATHVIPDSNKLFTVAYPATAGSLHEVTVTRNGARAAYPLVSESVVTSLDTYRLGTSSGVDAILYNAGSKDENIEFAYNMAGVAGGGHHVAALSQSFTSSIGQRLSDTLPPSYPVGASSETDDEVLDREITRGQVGNFRENAANTIWAAPVIGHQDGRDIMSGGLKYGFASDQYGALIGYEARTPRHGLWGIAGLVGGGNSVAKGTVTHTTSTYGMGGVGVYTKLNRGVYDFVGQIGWVGTDSKINQRQTGIGQFAADVNTGAFYLSLGFERKTACHHNRLFVIPTFSLDFTSVHQGNFVTTFNNGGATSDAFKADAGTANILSFPMGIKAFGTWHVGHSGKNWVRGDIAARFIPNVADHYLGYKNLPMSGTQALMRSAVADTFAGDLNTGITWSRNTLEFSMRYNGLVSERFMNHNAAFVVSKSF
ncbi:MAG: autotransporter-associated beta strand repeat-containing protein [Thermoguttaceae bacterium]